MDALNSLHSVTYDLDEKYGTAYHARFTKFLARMQGANLVIGGAILWLLFRKGGEMSDAQRVRLMKELQRQKKG